MKVVITGGGTGGHLSVAKAFLEECFKNGLECIFIGSNAGQDRIYFENNHYFIQKYFLKTCGVVNQKGIGKIRSLWHHFSAFYEVLGILRKEKINFVFSVGGYSAAPAAFAAIVLKIPLIIHEQNAQIGRLNTLLKPYAKLFFSSYLDTSPTKFYPINQAFFQTARIRHRVINVLFMGGSQGARTINNFALSVAEDMKARGIRIYHQCGKRDFERVYKEYQSLKLKLMVFEDVDKLEGDFDICLFKFSQQMPEIFRICDFALSRAGASSLWELCANGLPSLFIPYPYAASNHQYFNAKFLENKNLGFLCEEKNLFDEVLWDILGYLEEEKISQISKELQQQCSSNATENILQIILKNI